MQRSLVTPVGTIGRHHVSWPRAGSVNGFVLTMTSGGPNVFANAHSLGSGKVMGAGRSARIAQRGSAIDPARNGLDFGLGEPQVVLQVLDADMAVVAVWRHLAGHDLLLDRARPRPHFFEGRERHRPDRAGLMALLTVLLKNGRDITREGYLRGASSRLLCDRLPGRCSDKCQCTGSHPDGPKHRPGMHPRHKAHLAVAILRPEGPDRDGKFRRRPVISTGCHATRKYHYPKHLRLTGK